MDARNLNYELVFKTQGQGIKQKTALTNASYKRLSKDGQIVKMTLEDVKKIRQRGFSPAP